MEDIEVMNIIRQKMLGKTLTYQEIFTLMDHIAHRRLNKVQVAYYVAASFAGGFTDEELYFLTKAMVETGVKLNFKPKNGVVADKHSIGGVSGTRASMIVVPIIVSLGYMMPKTSSRAITTPSGTADTMEVFAPVDLRPVKVEEIVNTVGGCIIWGGHLGVAPADDVIINVEEELGMENYDKILTSILAKKVAMSSTHMILDIPVGKTMKIKHLQKGKEFGVKFATIAKKFGIEVLPDVNTTLEPAGNGIGPILEAQDVLKVLEQRADRPHPLEDRAIRLGTKLLQLIDPTLTHEEAEVKIHNALKSKKALIKFREIIEAQGGNPHITVQELKPGKKTMVIKAAKKGVVKQINNFNLNAIARLLGAPKDAGAGVYMHKKLNDPVHQGEEICTFYASSQHLLEEAQDTLATFPIYDIA